MDGCLITLDHCEPGAPASALKSLPIERSHHPVTGRGSALHLGALYLWSFIRGAAGAQPVAEIKGVGRWVIGWRLGFELFHGA